MSLGNTSLLSRKSRVKCCTVYIYFRIIYYVRCVLHAKPLWYPQVLFKREPCLPPPQTGKAGFSECGELHVWLTLRYPLAGRRLRQQHRRVTGLLKAPLNSLKLTISPSLTTSRTTCHSPPAPRLSWSHQQKPRETSVPFQN